MEIFGNTLFHENEQIDFQQLKKIISRVTTKPKFRISILHSDETVEHYIPDEDIVQDSIQYTETYQNGSRRTLQFQLINDDKKYSPNVNSIWLQTRFGFDIGLEYGNHQIIWFPKGVYVLNQMSSNRSESGKFLDIQLQDKFSIFEGSSGVLEDGYEIPPDSSVIDAVRGVLNFASGDQYILDSVPPLFDPSFQDFKTQSTIRIEEGGNLSKLFEELSVQMSCEYYYDNIGRLCFYPINETIGDQDKPIIWSFHENDVHQTSLSLQYNNRDVVNTVKVISDNIDNGVYSAVVENNNPRSPICVQQIGKRSSQVYNEPNVWSDQSANDLANYYLRKSSFLPIEYLCQVSFNPVLTVNNLCEIQDEFFGVYNEKFLITEISFSSPYGDISLKTCNIQELPSHIK